MRTKRKPTLKERMDDLALKVRPHITPILEKHGCLPDEELIALLRRMRKSDSSIPQIVTAGGRAITALEQALVEM